MGSTYDPSATVTVTDGARASEERAPLRDALDGPPTLIAGRYVLRGLLGTGGMGTVYRALDQELDEVVALKVLRRDLGQVPEIVERFRREVKLARKVTHRNVARTFDIGEHAGDRFLTMEYIDGEALSSTLANNAALRCGRVCAVALEICEGLAASHEAGVLHIDLKPENVICERSGRVVLTDFGISRALSGDSFNTPNATGAFTGTPAYMAPEHVEGAAVLDARADIYALGCMLFRMLTGRLPWRGATFLAGAAARLLHPPPDPRVDVPDLPDGVAEIVLKCMARDRERRYATAREVAEALLPFAERTELLGRTGPQPAMKVGAPKTLAVLPFENAEPADAYIALAFTEGLIDGLSAVPRLRVRPRRATERLAALDEPRDAGRALGVDVLVQGTLTRSGEALHVTLRLLTVDDGFQLWARSFDASTATLPTAIQSAASEIASALATEVEVHAPPLSADPIALDLYLRGRFIFTRSFAAVSDAIPLLREAHERAPDDVRIALTYVQALIRAISLGGGVESVELPRRIAESAVARDPEGVEARVALGLVHFEEGEYRSAALELRRALALDPQNTDALVWSGRMLGEAGRAEQAIERLTRARAQHPNDALTDAALARSYIALGDFRAALSVIRAPTLERNDAGLYWVLIARFVLWSGDQQLAARELARMASHVIEPASRVRATTTFRLACDRTLSREQLDELGRGSRSNLPRRDAFNTQIRMEQLTAAGYINEARQLIVSLDDVFFFDLSWLDSCPLLEPLRSTPEHASLRRSTVARVNRALEVFDARGS